LYFRPLPQGQGALRLGAVDTADRVTPLVGPDPRRSGRARQNESILPLMHVPPPDPREPCLCGSGRPFDGCCAEAYAETTAAWRRVREATPRLIKDISAYAVDRWGQDLLRGAFEQFQSSSDDRDMRFRWNLFYRWLAYTWIPNWDDPEDPPSAWPASPIGVVWLEAHRDSATEYDTHYVMTASESPCSLFRVDRVTPRWDLTVTDMMTGRAFRVIDPEVSTLVRPDEILVSAVLTLDGVSTLLGTGNCSLPLGSQREAAEICDAYHGRRWMSRAELLGHDYEFHGIYHKICLEGFDRYARELECGGAPFDPCLLRWRVTRPFAETIERLRPLTRCYEDDHAIDLVHRPDGEPEAELRWYQAGPSGHPDDWQSLACLYLTSGGAHLAAEVPTTARADALAAEIEARIGPAATLLERRRDRTMSEAAIAERPRRGIV